MRVPGLSRINRTFAELKEQTMHFLNYTERSVAKRKLKNHQLAHLQRSPKLLWWNE